MSKLIITGGCGFIGSNFVQFIQEQTKHEILLVVDKLTYAAKKEYVKGCNVLVQDIVDVNWAELLTSYAPDFIVHFAAESHVDNSLNTNANDVFIMSNILGTKKILDGLITSNKRHKTQLIHVSTDECLGDLPYNTLQSFDEDVAVNPNNLYSATKASAELLVKAYQHTYDNFEYTICRATNNFGPNQHPEKLIPKVIANALDNKDIPVYGNGKNVRDWLWTFDFAAGITAVIDKYATKKSVVANKIYHFGGAESISNLKLVKKILHIVNRSNDLITFVPDRLGHDRVYSLDYSRAANNLGWTPKVKLDEGLHLLIEDIQRKRGW